jgi:excisionase family DNA binding protein
MPENIFEQQSKPELTTGEVAREIGVSVVTVRKLTEEGQLAGWRIGSRYRYARRDVESFLSKSARPLAA